MFCPNRSLFLPILGVLSKSFISFAFKASRIACGVVDAMKLPRRSGADSWIIVGDKTSLGELVLLLLVLEVLVGEVGERRGAKRPIMCETEPGDASMSAVWTESSWLTTFRPGVLGVMGRNNRSSAVVPFALAPVSGCCFCFS